MKKPGASINIHSPVVLPARGDKLTRDQNKREAKGWTLSLIWLTHDRADRWEDDLNLGSHMRRDTRANIGTYTEYAG